MADADPIALVDHLFRRQAGQMVATLTRALGSRHLALAEDAVQEALVTAMQQWSFRGVPDNPEAWLFQVARHRALDRLRHLKMATEKEPAIVREAATIDPPLAEPPLRNELPPLEDDQLGLLFLTCHPALTSDARVALALKLVGGFSVDEIARAFLALDSAIAQRLVRAKKVLRDQQVSFGMPEPGELPARLDSVLHAIYLMFNEGYAATTGDQLIRDDVAAEAIRLARMIAMHPATTTPRAWALLSLMLLHAARFPARVDSDGTLFLLRDQDRAKWDHAMIAEGMRALDRASQGDTISAFHLEAGIAACHAAATSWQSTNWEQILELYDELLALTKSPVVAMNRAVAVSRVEGALSGLAALDAIENVDALERHPLLPAIQAELWREAGDTGRAIEHYQASLGLARSAPEQRWLMSRLALLQAIVIAVCALTMIACGGAHPTAPDAVHGLTTVTTTTEWPSATPASAGIDVTRVEDAVFRIRQGNYGRMSSLLVARNGQLVVEEYFDGMVAERAHTMQSVTKSVTSLLVGLAAQSGRLAINDRATRFLPQYEPLANDDDRKRAMTIGDLLTMRSGFDWDESVYAGSPLDRMNNCLCDWLRFVLDWRMRETPGTRFEYISGGTVLLGGIVGAATGARLDQFAAAQLFGPLGISGASWYQATNGLPHAGGGLLLRPRDMLKIGTLVLDDGRWHSQPIVDASWIRLTTTTRVSRGVRTWAGRPADYAYGWWLFDYRGQDVIAASGALGQWIFVVPSLRLVVTATGNNESGQWVAPLEILFANILPAITN
jgi:RNA polymerase sigma-70 factor, ECF subfamily